MPRERSLRSWPPGRMGDDRTVGPGAAVVEVRRVRAFGVRNLAPLLGTYRAVQDKNPGPKLKPHARG